MTRIFDSYCAKRLFTPTKVSATGRMLLNNPFFTQRKTKACVFLCEKALTIRCKYDSVTHHTAVVEQIDTEALKSNPYWFDSGQQPSEEAHLALLRFGLVQQNQKSDASVHRSLLFKFYEYEALTKGSRAFRTIYHWKSMCTFSQCLV